MAGPSWKSAATRITASPGRRTSYSIPAARSLTTCEDYKAKHIIPRRASGTSLRLDAFAQLTPLGRPSDSSLTFDRPCFAAEPSSLSPPPSQTTAPRCALLAIRQSSAIPRPLDFGSVDLASHAPRIAGADSEIHLPLRSKPLSRLKRYVHASANPLSLNHLAPDFSRCSNCTSGTDSRKPKTKLLFTA